MRWEEEEEEESLAECAAALWRSDGRLDVGLRSERSGEESRSNACSSPWWECTKAVGQSTVETSVRMDA